MAALTGSIQVRKDTAANWTAANPTLLNGEPALETDTGKLKYGDGSTAWVSLGYWEKLTTTEKTKLSNLSGTNTGDQDLSGYSPLASPTFTGAPLAPTASPLTNNTQLATTAYTDAAVAVGAPATKLFTFFNFT